MMNNFAPPPSLADMRRAISGPVVVISKSERIASFVRSEVKRSQSGGLPKREKSSIVSLSRMMLGRHKCNKSYESKQEEDAGLGDTSKRQQTYREEVESVKVYPKDFVKQHDAAITKYYFIKELLGEGGFAEVWRGVCKETGTERAVKIIEKTMLTESEYEHVVAEVDIMKDLDHPSINRIHHFFHDDVEFCIVQDLSKGGDLYDEVADTGRISEEDTATIMKELLSCVNYLHEEKAIVHRDINLENILLESNGDYSSLKLIDFGLACRYEGKPLREIVGKFHYCSPQVFKPSGYGPKADVWSCGVVAYICLGGFAPFDSPRELVIRDLVLEGAISFDDPEWKCISEEAKDFVKALLTYDEADRPSAKEVLQHPFITRIVKDATENFRRSSLGSASAALENMRSFSATTKLKEMICTFIAAQLLEKEEKEEIDKLFRAMDTNFDGKLSRAELQLGYHEYLGLELSADDLDEVFDRSDLDKSGYLEYFEFVIATVEKSCLLSQNRLKAVFNIFDKKGEGYITTENLKQNLSKTIDDEALSRILWQVDDGDGGRINFKKFQTIMQSG